jgi:Cytochrome c554 and c-prime
MRSVAFAAALALLAGCRRPPATSPPVLVMQAPPTVPTAVPVAELAGASACAECHAAIVRAWRGSPHGRAMAAPTEQSVLGAFDGAPVTLPDGTVTPDRAGGRWQMTIDGPAGAELRPVELVLASGRQHQLYVTRTDGGGYSLLPLIWCTREKEWIPTALYQSGALDPAARGWWARFELWEGCFSCHVSGARRRTGPSAATTEWADLAIDCESCHGPAREHIRRRRAGRADEVLRDLRPLGKLEDARVCGKCHGFQLKQYELPSEDGLPRPFVTSLMNDGLRPDGTQRSTSYQLPGHVLSECFKQGALTCKGCHEPHALTARDFLGASATGADSNRQCTICHRDRIAPEDARRHSHHADAIRCVDCHMAYSFIIDETRRQRTADHSISIPRPRESLELGTPNACTTCHRDRSPEWALGALERWGYRRATQARGWVRAVANARKRAPGASAELTRLLDDPASGTYLVASALDLLAAQPPDARLAPRLARYAADGEPQLRASAIRALATHDAAHRAEWLRRGLADPHPFVRMETFALVDDVQWLAPAALERELADALAHAQPPTHRLIHLITVRHKRGELREALALVELLRQVALPREQQSLHLDDVRARLTGALAGAATRARP